MLAQGFPGGYQGTMDCEPTPGSKRKTGWCLLLWAYSHFSLTWGLDRSEEVGASPREGCGSGLGPPLLPSALNAVVEAGVAQPFRPAASKALLVGPCLHL